MLIALFIAALVAFLIGNTALGLIFLLCFAGAFLLLVVLEED